MGKKYQLRRLDKFYHQAKTAGYRSRAAYKLIQLNRKYNFLQNSRVCIDLCAAPGSWMQVATRYMPVSSVVIGVDRYRIVPIPNAVSLQGDITTEKVRQDLKTHLKTWKADLVLHDGAPHVGQSWIQDAYTQNLLVLHAFKLACEFLRKDGTFITKIFRSKDHLSLQYTFRKLFKKVEMTKPIASRVESAEIFIVCKGFLSPDKVDPEFFDPKHVFESLDQGPTNKINLLAPDKKRKAVGYEEGITMLFEKKKISDFINSSDHIKLLEVANELEWDVPAAYRSTHTTSEIIEFCKDIKVLSRKDLRALINWRKAVKQEIEEKEEQKSVPNAEDKVVEEKDEEDEEMEELKKVQEQIAKLKADKEHEDKSQRRKLEKKRKKIQERNNLRLMIPGDPGPQEVRGTELFSLENLDQIDKLDDIVDKAGDMLVESESEDEDVSEGKKYYSRSEPSYMDSTGTYHKSVDDTDSEEEDSDGDASLASDDEGLRMDKEEAKEKKKKKRVHFAEQKSESDSDPEPDVDTAKSNPLLTDLVGDVRSDKRERKAESWFSNNAFDILETEEIEDFELDSAIQKYKELGGNVIDKGVVVAEETKRDKAATKTKKNEARQTKLGDVSHIKDAHQMKLSDDFHAEDAPVSDAESNSDSDSDSGVDADGLGKKAAERKKKEDKLSPYGLALATKMIHSKQSKRDMYDAGWNRHMFGDEKLPAWFVQDEEQYNSPRIKVDKRDLLMYENQDKPVDARTIKKVVEAKARKKRRSSKRMKKLRKMADQVTRNPDITAREKAIEVKKIYNKAFTTSKQKDKKYLVMKKSFGGKRPKGVKGPIKLVDRRLKKDKRAAERSQKRKLKSMKPKRPMKPKGKKNRKTAEPS